jgi:hypothetical protein
MDAEDALVHAVTLPAKRVCGVVWRWQMRTARAIGRRWWLEGHLWRRSGPAHSTSCSRWVSTFPSARSVGDRSRRGRGLVARALWSGVEIAGWGWGWSAPAWAGSGAKARLPG